MLRVRSVLPIGPWRTLPRGALPFGALPFGILPRGALLWGALLGGALGACGSTSDGTRGAAAPPVVSEEVPREEEPRALASEGAPAGPVVDDALGGRLYDRFYDGVAFSPARASTSGNAEGRGGPWGNGTLPLANGSPLLNDAGHDYRLKNFFGWDLRGAQGIYGAAYQDKATVIDRNLLDPEVDLEEIRILIRDGSEVVPAYGSILDEVELESLLAFVGGVRDGRLPHPDRIWSLSEGTPGNYRLAPGGDAARGKQLYVDRCAGCHGKDGTRFLFDEGAYSLGSHARQKAYEDWLKILNGHPFSKMKRFVRGANGEELGQEVLDLLAALCDRTEFPLGAASKPDVEEGDPRCGAYLVP